MLMVFFLTVLCYLVIGLGVALWMYRLLGGRSTLGEYCLYTIAWPVVLAVAAFHYWDD